MSEENKKIKILTLSDHPLSPSGVGSQTKYVIESLLKTGRYQVVSFGGAITHENYQPIRVAPYEDDWLIFPVDGYGDHDKIRSILRKERPDILWFMTDPRFYGWLWEIEDEIRANVPMVYYHVWDNFPHPHFNRTYYESTDVIVAISKVTDEIVKTVAPNVESHYVPHAVDSGIFQPLEKEDVELATSLRNKIMGEDNEDKLLFFWNNRNARRKQSGTLIYWFKDFLDEVGHDRAQLVMHTDPRDPNGQDLPHIIEHLGLTNGQVTISNQKVSPQDLAVMYNAADCTVNISDAEGFGLATLESLSCGTPIIVNMTGGLQEQVTDGKNWFGFGIEPASKAIIGSLNVPYIYEDRISKEDFVETMVKFSKMTKKQRQKMGAQGRKHVVKNYNFDNFEKQWVTLVDSIHERLGSWDNRENYKRWHFKEVA